MVMATSYDGGEQKNVVADNRAFLQKGFFFQYKKGDISGITLKLQEKSHIIA